MTSTAWWTSVADGFDTVTVGNAVRARRWHVVSQQVGAIGHALTYGHSQIIDPLGRIVADTGQKVGMVIWTTDLMLDAHLAVE